MNNNISDTEKLVAPLSELEDVIIKSVNDGGRFSLITAGVSMMPLLRNRKDTVILTKCCGRLSKYDIPLYKRTNGQFVLHRVMKVCDGGYVMSGDNQLHYERGITDDEIIAVASFIVRNGKTIDLKKTVSYKLYVFFWCRCYFIRYFSLKARALFRRIFHKNK